MKQTRPVRVGLVGTMSTAFQGDMNHQYAQSIEALQALAERWKFELHPVRHGIYTVENGVAAVRQLRDWDLDFIMVQVCGFGPGKVIESLAELDGKLGLWAVPEGEPKVGGMPLLSLGGMTLYNSILGLYQTSYQRPVKWYYGRPDDPNFVERFRITMQALRALVNLREAKIGLIGGVAPGFDNLKVDERDLYRQLGTRVVNIEFDWVQRRASKYSEEEVVIAAKKIRADAATFEAGMEPALDSSARVYLACVDLAREMDLDALALSTWPRFQKEMGIAVESVLGRLNEDRLVTANEGDVYSAASMLALKYMSDDGVVTLMDLGDLDEADQSLLFWHDGPTAASLADDRGVNMQHLWLFDSYRKGGIGLHNDLVLKPGPATLMAFTRDFREVFVLGGEFNNLKPSWTGSRGWLQNLSISGRPVRVAEVLQTIMASHMQHHYPVAYGDLQPAALELAAWLRVTPIQVRAYTPYLEAN